MIIVYAAIAILLSLTAFRWTYPSSEDAQGNVIIGDRVRDSLFSTVFHSVLWLPTLLSGAIQYLMLRKKLRIRRD